MLQLANLFIAQAWAQNAAPAAAAGSPVAGSSFMQQISGFLPLILIFAVFYILIIRPQQRKMDEQNKMIAALKRGDRVITGGGIYGKVTKLEDDTLTIEIADGVNVKVVRSQVQALAAKTDTAIVANDDEKKN